MDPISPIPNGILNPISGTMLDEFAIFGFIGGVIGYAWYSFTARNDPKNHMNIFVGIYGTFLSGCLGSLLAIVFDRRIELSIIVGLTNQLLYLAITRAVKGGKFFSILKEVLIRMLSGGLKP